ncbi:phosphatidate cytidylyltransferase [Desulfosporosinus sp. BICA1-9]|uniref:phosphatidate cytidylyltransferase n=1 Tax=Desulfosporosinus sp. BICA1-9 TaxID=1531958 RepID=UPI00054BFDC2|nr:phosphatidate cytidylyltransferase [Desulfosporosinus sp. BICA1-9]KJS45923.1 MAG: phosphatidate cytidylyltransferase [Peptococcaceae bacterium BRH_c23]KJS85737.1 MAG: phosphatidate cytidylyltransferase [Desulfosporosinus sp. BICA1-9]HBW39078.1 phosphatidate cytidylyltransferase [Desulfosporosinus sp.]
MFIRTMSALIGAPIFLALIYFGGSYIIFLVTLLTLLALREFLQIGEQMGIRSWRKFSTIFAVIWLIGLFNDGGDWMLPALLLWLLIGFGRLALTYPKTSLNEANYNILSVVYTVILLSHLYLLRELPRGIEWTFLTIFLVWATDTGAYLIGRQFGRHRLAPHVSPKKTVEGSVGGLLFSIGIALGFWRFVGGAHWMTYIILGLVIGTSAQIGDLFESALKRSAGVKDSGSLIPGHGGILDRFDSLIFAIPLVYYGIILLS